MVTAGVRDKPRVERHMMALDIVGQVRVPEPVPVGQQVQPADHCAAWAQHVMHERGRGGQDRTGTQVLDQLASVRRLLGANGGPERRAVRPTVPELLELSDERKRLIDHPQKVEHVGATID